MEDKEPCKKPEVSVEEMKRRMIKRVQDDPTILDKLRHRLQTETFDDWDIIEERYETHDERRQG